MTTIRSILLLAIALACAAVSSAWSAPADLSSTARLPGSELTQGISELTGVAVSPMLGVSAVGAWRYYRTPESERHRLPWFCHPLVWGIGFFLLGLVFLKDLLGTAMPALIKKPLDIAELFENKVSALVASVAFLPFIATQIAEPLSAGHWVLQSAPANLHFASIFPFELASFAAGAYWLVLPLCVVAFFVVWLTSHAINVLIALCPFGFVDALLKLFKIFILTSIVGSYFINPYFGAVVSLAVICIAAMLAPWAFRLTVFGTVLATDTILASRAGRNVRPERPHAFLARRIGAAPVRTLGHLTREADETVRFRYRPWLILRERSIALPQGARAISKGAIFPALIQSAQGGAFTALVNFPPRYRGQETAIAAHFAIRDIRDGALVRGLKSVRAWIADTLNLAL